MYKIENPLQKFTSFVFMFEQSHGWDDLRVVLAVGRTGSLSAAARTLKVSHPTVFRRVNQIEERLGVHLFERSRNGYSLTVAGEEMMALAERVENDVTAVERRLAGRDMRPFGLVRVTTTDTLLIGFLSRIFADFREAHPDIELSVMVSNELFSISKRDADVAIRPSRDVPEELVGRRASDVGMAVFGHEDTRTANVQQNDLHGYPWVGPDESLSYLPVAKWLRDRDLERCVVYRSNTLLGCMDAIRNGIGIGVLPCYLGAVQPDLVRIGAPIKELASELWLLTHPDLRNVARIRVFLDFAAEALKPHRSRLEGTDSSASAK